MNRRDGFPQAALLIPLSWRCTSSEDVTSPFFLQMWMAARHRVKAKPGGGGGARL